MKCSRIFGPAIKLAIISLCKSTYDTYFYPELCIMIYKYEHKNFLLRYVLDRYVERISISLNKTNITIYRGEICSYNKFYYKQLQRIEINYNDPSLLDIIKQYLL